MMHGLTGYLILPSPGQRSTHTPDLSSDLPRPRIVLEVYSYSIVSPYDTAVKVVREAEVFLRKLQQPMPFTVLAAVIHI